MIYICLKRIRTLINWGIMTSVYSFTNSITWTLWGPSIAKVCCNQQFHMLLHTGPSALCVHDIEKIRRSKLGAYAVYSKFKLGYQAQLKQNIDSAQNVSTIFFKMLFCTCSIWNSMKVYFSPHSSLVLIPQSWKRSKS